MNLQASSMIHRPRLDFLSLLALLCGLTSTIQFQFLGQLFLGEIILVILGLLLVADKFIPTARPIRQNILDSHLFKKFLIVLCLSFLGLALSDFWVNSVPKDYLRGWAKIIFLALDMIALSFLGFKNRWNLWCLGLGIGLGISLSFLLPSQVSPYSIAAWKVTYAEPIAYLVLCISPFFGALAPLPLSMLGVTNILLDYRSFGLIFLIIGALTWSKIYSPGKVKGKTLLRLLLPLGLALMILAFLVQTTQSEFADRRTESNTSRFGGIQVAIEAIAESPLLGRGSWAKSDQLAERYLDLTDGNRDFASVDRIYAEEVIPAHSQILQAWVEGGILGTTFFIFYGYKLIGSLGYYITKASYSSLFPFFVFSLTNSSWHLFLSPFASTQRIVIALAVSIICLSDLEKTTEIKS